MAKINIDELALEVMKDLELFRAATVEVVKDATDRSAQMTVQDLRSSSPRSNTKTSGTYAASWNTKRDKNLTGKWKYSRVVYSAKPEYRLTHLLEKGHAKVGGGRVNAKVHIAPAEEQAIKNFETYLRQGIEAASK